MLIGCSHYKNDIYIGQDGDSIVAVRDDFFNLQESPAGFGDTVEEAIADLIEYEGGEA